MVSNQELVCCNITLILEPIHRCRNRGGTDVTICSDNIANKFNDTGDNQKDLKCGRFRPLVRYCHLAGLNNPSNGIFYKFSPYANFDSATAHTTCEEIGGFLPHLETELDFYYLVNRMEYLLGFVSLGQPFSLKWMSWPVSTKQCWIQMAILNTYLNDMI